MGRNSGKNLNHTGETPKETCGKSKPKERQTVLSGKRLSRAFAVRALGECPWEVSEGARGPRAALMALHVGLSSSSFS